MSETSKKIWNLDLLAEATTQIVVVTDTHFILPDNQQSTEWSAVQEFPARTTRALRLAAGLPRDAAVHLGDISHEYPETGRADVAQQGALDQFASLGLDFHQAAGNMDIGDKPDPTSPAQWVTPGTLNAWHARCGRSWFSFDAGTFHGVLLNTQIMNGPLPAATEQQEWAEHDLRHHSDRRTMLFLHMPIFHVDRNEVSSGFYNSLDEPARSWLLGLIERYSIEHVFTGHTHTVQINRHGSARLWTVPSTATSRAGLAEAYSIVGPDRGRGDIDKLGFSYVRETEHGVSVHLVRTGRETPALSPDDDRQLVMTRTSRDLPGGRLGVFATHPLGHPNPGPVIWPSIVRQPVRDDFRLMSLLETGARFVRVPASDLATETEAPRLALLRDETIQIEPYWVYRDWLDLVAETSRVSEHIDGAEVILPGETLPPRRLIDQIAEIQGRGLPVKLTTAMVDDVSQGQYHPRTRVGFHSDELRPLDLALEGAGISVDRVACRMKADDSIPAQVASVSNEELSAIGGIDWYLDFPATDDSQNAALAADAVVAVATNPLHRLVLGPHVDFDRSMDVARGLIDRLSNPSPAFRVVTLLNSLLFGDRDVTPALMQSGWIGTDSWRLRLIRDESSHALLLTEYDDLAGDGDRIELFDLSQGLSQVIESDGGLEAALDGLGGPGALVGRVGSS